MIVQSGQLILMFHSLEGSWSRRMRSCTLWVKKDLVLPTLEYLLPGQLKNLPLEVALMRMAGVDPFIAGGTSSFSTELLDWSELQDEVVLVMQPMLQCSARTPSITSRPADACRRKKPRYF